MATVCRRITLVGALARLDCLSREKAIARVEVRLQRVKDNVTKLRNNR